MRDYYPGQMTLQEYLEFFVQKVSGTMKKVLVFGIFDGIHPGHISFFRQAKKHGDFLIVAVGRASACRQIKCKTPKLSLRKRLTALRTAHLSSASGFGRAQRGEPLVDKAIPGDVKQGSYKVVLREKPDVICLGYDQKELAKDLKRWIEKKNFPLFTKILKPYEPARYHSSLLTRNTSIPASS